MTLTTYVKIIQIGGGSRILNNYQEEIWEKVWNEDLDKRKREILVKIWKVKEKIVRKRESEKVKG